MSNIVTISRDIAAEPIPPQQVKTTVSGGFAMSEQKLVLAPLKVVFGTEIDGKQIKRGDVIYIRGEAYATKWSKIIYRVDEEEFILVPVGEVILHEVKKK